MKPFELDSLRAGVTETQVASELALDERYFRSSQGDGRIDETVSARLGKPVSDDGRFEDDASSLGALLGIASRPLPFSTLMRSLGWSLDRVNNAKNELADRLGTVGMALFEFQDESIQIGARTDESDWEVAQADALAQKGLSITEATLLRHIVSQGFRSSADSSSTIAGAIRGLRTASLIDRTSIEFEASVAVLVQEAPSLGTPIVDLVR